MISAFFPMLVSSATLPVRPSMLISMEMSETGLLAPSSGAPQYLAAATELAGACRMAIRHSTKLHNCNSSLQAFCCLLLISLNIRLNEPLHCFALEK
jgi:hypothetical protein